MNLKHLLSTLTLLIAANGVIAQLAPLEFWSFDDPQGTDLKAATNSGSLGSSWNFNTTGDSTNGAGLFVITSGNGQTTRKLPDGANENAAATNLYASPLATGTYVLQVDFAAWSVDPTNSGDSWKIGIKDSANKDIAQVIFDINSTTGLRLRASTLTTAGANFRNFDYPLVQASPVSLAVEFDFDNDTVRYLLDGTEQFAWTDFTGADISSVVYSRAGTWGATPTTISIDQMGISEVTAVPEPATIGLFAGAFVLVWVVRRRR